MPSMEAELFVERISTNKLNETKLKEQVKEITAAAKRANGVKSDIDLLPVSEKRPDGYYYSFTVMMTKDNYRSETAAQKAIENAKRFVTRAAIARQWKVAGDAEDVKERQIAAMERGKFEVDELTPEVMEQYFGGIYERDAQIRLIHRSVELAAKTDFEERNHVLLYGQPAAAKTILFQRLKAWYESKNPNCERVAFVNSTTISKAGLETWILEKAKDGLLPEILCFDEIEKFNMDNLTCLLAIMDEQGVISRTNAKIGKQEAKARVIVWATCNNITKIQAFNDNALWSRFTKRYACVRPSRELMLEIMVKRLERRAERGLHVDMQWAKAAVDYGFDKLKTNDPRTIAGMLEGEDGLLDGTYFKQIEDIRMAEKIDIEIRQKLS